MNTSQRKVEANRENARRSTGPRTARGKRASSRNALAHGLTARAGLLPGDDPEDYRRFVRAVLDELDPQGPIQEELAGEIANLSWKLRRVPGAEGILLEQTHSAGAEEPTDVIVNMILDKNWRSQPRSPLWLLARYTRQAERSRATAMRLFLSLRKSNEKRDDELSKRLEDAPHEGDAPEDEKPVDEAPANEAPKERVPEEHVPEEHVPEEHVPEERVPEERVPEESRAEDEAPENVLPLRNEANAAAEGAGAQVPPPRNDAAATGAPPGENDYPAEANSDATRLALRAGPPDHVNTPAGADRGEARREAADQGAAVPINRCDDAGIVTFTPTRRPP